MEVADADCNKDLAPLSLSKKNGRPETMLDDTTSNNKKDLKYFKTISDRHTSYERFWTRWVEGERFEFQGSVERNSL
jgi:hypothetical protein